jgi:hypothetical protein
MTIRHPLRHDFDPLVFNWRPIRRVEAMPDLIAARTLIENNK